MSKDEFLEVVTQIATLTDEIQHLRVELKPIGAYDVLMAAKLGRVLDSCEELSLYCAKRLEAKNG